MTRTIAFIVLTTVGSLVLTSAVKADTWEPPSGFLSEWITVVRGDMYYVTPGGPVIATAAHGAFYKNDADEDGNPLLGLLRDGGTVQYANDPANPNNKTNVTFDKGIFSSSFTGVMAPYSTGIEGFDWNFLEKLDIPEDDPPSVVEGPTFTVEFDPEDQFRKGTITFHDPLSSPFAISLKGGNGYVVYAFDSVPDDGIIYFDITTALSADLSHASEFYVMMSLGEQIDVPEPSVVLGLLSMGVLGLFAVRRRKRA